MKSNTLFFIELIVSFLPFVLFAFLNNKTISLKSRKSRYDRVTLKQVNDFAKRIIEILNHLNMKTSDITIYLRQDRNA